MKRGSLFLIALLAPAMVTAQSGQPIITGYRHQGCLNKGDQLVIQGQGFGNAQAGRKVRLWFAGQTVEVVVLTWLDNQVVVRVPDDPRVKAGGMYEVRFETGSGQPLGATGPMLRICEAEQEPAHSPSAPADQSAVVAQRLAGAVMQASGAAQWSKVTRLRFTFNVAQDGQTLVRAAHDWDRRAQTDRVRWADKDVTVNLRAPGDDPDARAAYQRWVNDSYWLLAPLKLRDRGVRLEYAGRHTVGTHVYEVLVVSFASVGLTPGDRYYLYIDPQTHLVRAWDYQPDAQRRVTGTWEGYQEFNGLMLSTEHEFGGKRVWFTDIEVITD